MLNAHVAGLMAFVASEMVVVVGCGGGSFKACLAHLDTNTKAPGMSRGQLFSETDGINRFSSVVREGAFRAWVADWILRGWQGFWPRF
jgi:hypothetical protein